MPAVAFALLAALCFSLNALWGKFASRHAVTDRAAFVFLFSLASVLFLPLVLLRGVQNPLPAFVPLLAFAAAFFLGQWFTTYALFSFDVSILQPFFHFQSILSVGLAFLILGERFPLQAYLWILGIVVGGILVGIDESWRPRALRSRAFAVLLLGLACFAVSDILANRTLQILDVLSFKFWGVLLVFIFSCGLLPRAWPNLRVSFHHSRPLLISSAFFFLATLFLFRAFADNVTLTQPIAMLGSLFTFLAAVLLARIRSGLLEAHAGRVYAVRALGVLLMLSSAIFLARTPSH